MNKSTQTEILEITNQCLQSGVRPPFPIEIIMEAMTAELEKVFALKYNNPSDEVRTRANEIIMTMIPPLGPQMFKMAFVEGRFTIEKRVQPT